MGELDWIQLRFGRGKAEYICTYRQGSSDEVALLVADFGLLDCQLAEMCDAIDSGNPSLIDGDDLARLAVEVPDIRSRLGIG